MGFICQAYKHYNNHCINMLKIISIYNIIYIITTIQTIMHTLQQPLYQYVANYIYI
ncbi:hypothetical protein HanRHA438_Chr14g0663291 [Helianthus annuus]|nr:hypothetical protein HanRHA438_Chr14g0663291 [Helianthus annuus]